MVFRGIEERISRRQQSIKGLQSWSSRYDSVKVRHFSLPKFCCYFIQKQSKLV